MRKSIYLFALLIVVSCSSTRIVDRWKNQEYANYQPKKILIVGVTENLTARKLFEAQLKNELQSRGIEAVESYNVFTTSFSDSKQTEEALTSIAKTTIYNLNCWNDNKETENELTKI
jgi:hypothetical protein